MIVKSVELRNWYCVPQRMHNTGNEVRMHKPVFIALAGSDPETDILYDKLSTLLCPTFPGRRVTLFDDPFEEYHSITVGQTLARDLSPLARVHMRWALFAEFNARVIAPALRTTPAPEIMITRRYGFDLIAGSAAFDAREDALAIHEVSVQKCIVDLGIAPPRYVFTSRLLPAHESLRERYFALPGQNAIHIDPRYSVEDKAEAILGLIQAELQPFRPAIVA